MAVEFDPVTHVAIVARGFRSYIGEMRPEKLMATLTKLLQGAAKEASGFSAGDGELSQEEILKRAAYLRVRDIFPGIDADPAAQAILKCSIDHDDECEHGPHDAVLLLLSDHTLKMTRIVKSRELRARELKDEHKRKLIEAGMPEDQAEKLASMAAEGLLPGMMVPGGLGGMLGGSGMAGLGGILDVIRELKERRRGDDSDDEGDD